MRWRDDKLNPNDHPSALMVVICAEDTPKRSDDYHLVITHVRSFHGKGFMASVRSNWGESMQNGSVFRGEGAEAYALAQQQGESMFNEQIAIVESRKRTQPEPKATISTKDGDFVATLGPRGLRIETPWGPITIQSGEVDVAGISIKVTRCGGGIPCEDAPPNPEVIVAVFSEHKLVWSG